MYEIKSDKVMMVCMTMVRLYVVNVTASNRKKEWHLFLQGTPWKFEASCLLKVRGREGQGEVVRGEHLIHFLPLQTAAYLSEAKGTCSWTVAGPTSPPPPPPFPPSPSQYLEKRRELAVYNLDLNGVENKKVEEWDERRQDIRFRNNE